MRWRGLASPDDGDALALTFAYALVVTSEFADVIESIMPGPMRVFTSTDDVAEFSPGAPGEERWAKEASEYVPHVFMRQNDGFRILYWLIKDALMYRLAAVTVDLEGFLRQATHSRSKPSAGRDQPGRGRSGGPGRRAGDGPETGCAVCPERSRRARGGHPEHWRGICSHLFRHDHHHPPAQARRRRQHRARGHPVQTARDQDKASFLGFRKASPPPTWSTLLPESGDGVSLRKMIDRLLAAHAGRIAIEGCDVTITSQVAQQFALIVHELATNALKYGALSMADGHVMVSGSLERQGGRTLFVFSWREGGGPPVALPTRRGFGRTILRDSARYFAERVVMDYAPEGLNYRLQVAFAGISPASGPTRRVQPEAVWRRQPTFRGRIPPSPQERTRMPLSARVGLSPAVSDAGIVLDLVERRIACAELGADALDC
jgi:hypothetical protein